MQHGMATGLPSDQSRCKDSILQVGHNIKHRGIRALLRSLESLDIKGSKYDAVFPVPV